MQNNINHEASTKYLKAVYYKFQSAIAEYKSQSAVCTHPLFDNSKSKSIALESLLEDIGLADWMKEIEQLEKESKQ
jgi:hypothetical protein